MKSGRERINAVMEGKTPDRVPVICNLADQGAAELGMTLEEYYSLGENVAEGQLRMREKYGYDSLLGFFYSALEAELLGCRNVIFAKDGPPNVGHLIISKPRDIEKLRIPDDLTFLPKFREQLKCINILKEIEGGNYPVISVVTASFSLPPLLMGIEGWMRLFLTGPRDLCLQLLEKCSEFCVRHIQTLREAGTDLIAYANPVASATFLRYEQFRELALPWVIRDVGKAGPGDIIYFNGGGRINTLLETIMRETGLRAFHINPLDDIAEAKKILAGRALLIAAINDIRLINWTGEEIEREVRRIMDAGRPGSGFLFGTLMMPCYIPETSIRVMLEAAYRLGNYGSADKP